MIHRIKALVAALLLAAAGLWATGGCSETEQRAPGPSDPAEIIATPHPDRLLAVYWDRLYAVDLAGGTAALIDQVQYPHSIRFIRDGELAVVYCSRQASVYLVDLGSQRFEPAGVIPIDDWYDWMYVSGDESMVVLAAEDGRVTFHDLETGEFVGAVDLPFELIDVAFTPDGRTMLASTHKGSLYTRVMVVDLETFEFQGVLVMGTHGRLVVTPDGSRVFVYTSPSWSSRLNVSVVDLQTLRVTAEIQGGGHLVLTPDRQYVAGVLKMLGPDIESGRESGYYVGLIRPDTLETRWIFLGDLDYRLPAVLFSGSGRIAIVLDDYFGRLALDLISVVDIGTGEVSTFDDLSGVSPGFELAADERKVYVLPYNRELSKIDLTAGTMTEIPLRFDPGNFSVNADGTRLIITGPLGRDLYVMDTRTDRLTAQIQLPLP